MDIDEKENVILIKDGVKFTIDEGTSIQTEPETDSVVEVKTRAGFVKSVAKALLNGAAEPTEKNWHISEAVKNKWVEDDLTSAQWANPISRGEAAAILVRAKGYERGWNYEYNDVQGDKYEKEIMTVLAQGLIEGYSTGNFKPDSALSVKDSEIIIENMGKPFEELSKNWKLSPDGRKLRVVNLPSNAEDFPYILADTSNEYYEGCAIISKETGAYYDLMAKRPKNIIRPVDLTKDLCDIPYMGYRKDDDGYEDAVAFRTPYLYIYRDQAKFELVLSRYKRYLELNTNVDYRTIDDSWAEEMSLALYPQFSREEYREAQGDGTGRNIFQFYVDYAKKHKIIIKSNRIQVEPSAVYNMDDMMVFRAYVDFDVINFENLGTYDEDYFLLTWGNNVGDIESERVVKGNYKGHLNNLWTFSKYAKRDTDFVSASTEETGVALGIFDKHFEIKAFE